MSYDVTDWQLAGTDDTAADAAAKTATNYLAFEDGTGLIVGDMTEETLGNNVLIDSEGMKIRDGSDTVASFEADKIDLTGSKVAEVDLPMVTLYGRTTQASGAYFVSSNLNMGYKGPDQTGYTTYPKFKVTNTEVSADSGYNNDTNVTHSAGFLERYGKFTIDGNPVSDHVVAYKSTTISSVYWEFELWASGRIEIEAWGTVALTKSVAWGNIGYSSTSIGGFTYPKDADGNGIVLSQIPFCETQIYTTSGNWWPILKAGSKTATPSGYAATNASGRAAESCTVSQHIKGIVTDVSAARTYLESL